MRNFTRKTALTLCAALFSAGLVQANDPYFNNPLNPSSFSIRNIPNNFSGQYLGTLVVTVDDNQTPETEESVTIEANEDFTTATFILKNFMLYDGGEEPTPVGHIRIPDIPVTLEDGVIRLVSSVEIKIEAGDEPGFWLGPILPEIPIEIDATIEGNHTEVLIDILLGEGEDQQVIGVYFQGDKDFPDAVTTIEALQKESYVYRINEHSIGVYGIDEGANYQIYSHSGALVMNGQLRSTSINTERLMQGIYILRVGNKVMKFVR